MATSSDKFLKYVEQHFKQMSDDNPLSIVGDNIHMRFDEIKVIREEGVLRIAFFWESEELYCGVIPDDAVGALFSFTALPNSTIVLEWSTI